MKRLSPDEHAHIPAKLKFKRRKLEEEFQRMQKEAESKYQNEINQPSSNSTNLNIIDSHNNTNDLISIIKDTSPTNRAEIKTNPILFATPKQISLPVSFLESYNAFNYFCLDPSGSHIELPNIQLKGLLLLKQEYKADSIYYILIKYKDYYYFIISNIHTIITSFRMNPEKSIFEQLNIIAMMMEEEEEQMDVLKVLGLFSFGAQTQPINPETQFKEFNQTTQENNNTIRNQKRTIQDILLLYESQFSKFQNNQNIPESDKQYLYKELDFTFNLKNDSESKLIFQFIIMCFNEFQTEKHYSLQFQNEFSNGIPNSQMIKPIFLNVLSQSSTNSNQKDLQSPLSDTSHDIYLNFFKYLTPSQKHAIILQYSHYDISNSKYPIFSLKYLDQAYGDAIQRYRATFLEDPSQRETALLQLRNLTTYQIHFCRQLRISGDIFNSLIVLYYLVILFAYGSEWMIPFDEKQEQLLIQSIREFVSGYTFSIIQSVNEEIRIWWMIAMQELTTIQNSYIETHTAACAIKHGWNNEILIKVMNGHRPSFDIWKNMEPITCGLMRIDMLIHQKEYQQSYFISASIEESIKWFQIMMSKSRNHTATLIVLKYENNPFSLFEMAKFIYDKNSIQGIFLACRALEITKKLLILNLNPSLKTLSKFITDWIGENYLCYEQNLESVHNSSFVQAIAQHLYSSRYEIAKDNKSKLYDIYDKWRNLTDFIRPLAIGFILKHSFSEDIINVAKICYNSGKKKDTFDLLLWVYHIDGTLLTENDTDKLLNIASEFGFENLLIESSGIVLQNEIYPDHPLKLGANIPYLAPISFKWTKITYQKDINLAYQLGVISLFHPSTELNDKIDIQWFLQFVCLALSKVHYDETLWNIESLRIRLHPTVLKNLLDHFTQTISFDFSISFNASIIRNALTMYAGRAYSIYQSITLSQLEKAENISYYKFIDTLKQLIPPIEQATPESTLINTSQSQIELQNEDLSTKLIQSNDNTQIHETNNISTNDTVEEITQLNSSDDTQKKSNQIQDNSQINADAPPNQDIQSQAQHNYLSTIEFEEEIYFLIENYKLKDKLIHLFLIAYHWSIIHIHINSFTPNPNNSIILSLYDSILDSYNKIDKNISIEEINFQSIIHTVYKVTQFLKSYTTQDTNQIDYNNELSILRNEILNGT